MGDDDVNLPPGFRFYPTDEELVVHFLRRKAELLPCRPDVIPDLGLYPYDPWDLDGKALAGGNQWYFFSRRTANRVSENGYWSPLGGDEPIVRNSDGKKVGMKKYLCFYLGEAPMGAMTNWMMHEFRLSDSSGSSSTSTSTRSSKRRGTPKLDSNKWVLCQVFERNCGSIGSIGEEDGTELSCLDEVFWALDDFDEISFPN